MDHSYSTYNNRGCRCEVCRAAYRAYYGAYTARNREHIRELARLSYQRNQEARTERRRAQYAANRAERRVKANAYEATRREYHRTRGRRYYETNKADIRERQRAYLQTEVGRLGHVARRHVRRAREQAAPGRATVAQILGRIAMFGGRCWICGGSADTLDHVIALARGGANWPANLRPACKPCNSRKRDH